jgi:hypothetical protein
MGTVVSLPVAPIAVGSIVPCHANRHFQLPYSAQRVLANEVAEREGFKMVWVYEPPEGPITDFNSNHPYDKGGLIKTLCHCKNVNGGKKVMSCSLEDGWDFDYQRSWLCLWRALEKYYAKKQCPHYFIEGITSDNYQKGKRYVPMIVKCGS